MQAVTLQEGKDPGLALSTFDKLLYLPARSC